jgi:putative membrane protein
MTDSAGRRAWLAVYLKGACMGAADTVPGVSGGTIAVILGVYERLIAALTSVDPRAMRHLSTLHTPEGRAALAEDLLRMDAPFMLVLGAGVLSAAATLATVMHVAVDQYPVPTHAFFFGLIAASAVVLYRYVDAASPTRAVVATLGFLLAFVVTGISATSPIENPPLSLLFLAGAVAITAMVLPGISGSFLLFALGLYNYMTGLPGALLGGLLQANGGDWTTLTDALGALGAFGAGAVIGVFTVAYAVRAALRRYREATFVFLVSLMVGALRLPIELVARDVGEPTAGTAALVVVPAAVGVTAVLALDRYTDDLEY